MKNKNSFITVFLIITIILFSSCKNVKIDEDYYYTETDVFNGMSITLKGKGYGVYGQMLEKYKSGSIKELMEGQPMKIRTSSSDDNNSSYNEVFLTFKKNTYIKSFDTEISAIKPAGLAQVKVSYTDENDKEYSLTSSTYLKGKVNVNKNVKSIILYIRAYKFYPASYSSLVFKGDLTAGSYEELNGRQVNNELSINYIRIEE